jgi:hypothetical protein
MTNGEYTMLRNALELMEYIATVELEEVSQGAQLSE